MKTKATLCLALVLCSLAPLALGTGLQEVTLDEYGFSITLPPTSLVATRDLKRIDAGFADIGYDKEWFQDYFASNEVDLFVVDRLGFLMKIALDESSSNLTWDSDFALKMGPMFAESVAKGGFKVLDISFLTSRQALYCKVYGIDAAGKNNGIATYQYMTAYKGLHVNVSLFGDANTDDNDFMDAIVKSIRYDRQ